MASIASHVKNNERAFAEGKTVNYKQFEVVILKSHQRRDRFRASQACDAACSREQRKSSAHETAPAAEVVLRALRADTLFQAARRSHRRPVGRKNLSSGGVFYGAALQSVCGLQGGWELVFWSEERCVETTCKGWCACQPVLWDERQRRQDSCDGSGVCSGSGGQWSDIVSAGWTPATSMSELELVCVPGATLPGC